MNNDKPVILCPHALAKMQHTQRNMMRYFHAPYRGRRRRRARYWARQFLKWSSILITRGDRANNYDERTPCENTTPSTNQTGATDLG